MDVVGISPSTNQMTSTRIPLSRRRRFTGALAVGFFALTAAILAVRSTPIDAYELSIYGATPLAFWVGVVVAIAALSVLPGIVSRRLGLLIGPVAVVSTVVLPLLHDYYFFGAGDTLSYLGWARLIADEQLNPVEFLYPGIESTAIFFSLLVLYVLFRYVTDNGAVVGLYDGFRYGEEGFQEMDANPRIHRVQLNGDFRLYVVPPEGSTCMS